jgi:1,2-diacylglycerol 3-beta-galactosyltransferase
MGPIGTTAHAIDDSGLDVCLVVAAGRNERLKTRLESQAWENRTLVYGFTREMPDFMRAADILVTKAGPSTLAEGLIASLPIVMYAKLPGQEDGNVTFIEQAGAGVFAPTPQLVVRAITRWICRPQEYEQIAENALRAARPDSARTIASAIGEHLGLKPSVKTRVRKSKI